MSENVHKRRAKSLPDACGSHIEYAQFNLKKITKLKNIIYHTFYQFVVMFNIVEHPQNKLSLILSQLYTLGLPPAVHKEYVPPF